MPDLQNLLDQIDRLDRTATTGPWILETDTHRDLIKSPADDQINLVATVVSPIMDSQLIALSRTALPALSRAVRAVLKECESFEIAHDDSENAFHEGVQWTVKAIRQGITDTLGADGD